MQLGEWIVNHLCALSSATLGKMARQTHLMSKTRRGLLRRPLARALDQHPVARVHPAYPQRVARRRDAVSRVAQEAAEHVPLAQLRVDGGALGEASLGTALCRVVLGDVALCTATIRSATG